MKFTNKHFLPEAVFRTLSTERYSGVNVKHDYSATTLLKPPQMVMLERRHADEVTEDVIDRLWSMFGSIAHTLLEEHCPEEQMAETRLFATVNGRVISGQFDGYNPANCSLHDYKVTSVWSLVYDTRAEEWEEQLNILAFLLRKHNYKVNSLNIVAILRDWSRSKALQGCDYPQRPIEIIDFPVWSMEKQEEFVSLRVRWMIENEARPDHLLTPCTAEEMWEKPTEYAVMKEGRKSAVRLCETQEAADALCEANGKGHSVVVRPGRRTRCEEYCRAAPFCHQFRAYRMGRGE